MFYVKTKTSIEAAKVIAKDIIVNGLDGLKIYFDQIESEENLKFAENQTKATCSTYKIIEGRSYCLKEFIVDSRFLRKQSVLKYNLMTASLKGCICIFADLIVELESLGYCYNLTMDKIIEMPETKEKTAVTINKSTNRHHAYLAQADKVCFRISKKDLKKIQAVMDEQEGSKTHIFIFDNKDADDTCVFFEKYITTIGVFREALKKYFKYFAD